MNIFFRPKIRFNDKELDKYQTRIVLDNSKHSLVVAAAGSGKTFTIAAKINYLVNELEVDPKNILCISFTNESVNDMKRVFNSNNLDIDVMTFHKFSMSILYKENYRISFTSLLPYIVTEYLENIIYFDRLGALYDEYLKDNSINKEYLYNSICSFINTFKSYGLNINDFIYIIKSSFCYEDKLLLIIIFKIYIIYEEELSSLGMLDFDDLIMRAIDKVDYMKYFKYKYIIIDEYQDTSFIRYRLIKRIIDRFDINLMCVGDDFQSIYKFNGCDIELFTNFKKYFNDSKILKLKYTYRNPKDVVNISSRFIMKNNYQIKKRLISNKYVDNSINVVFYKDLYSAYIKVIEELDNIMILGRNNDDINMINNGDYNYKDKSIRYLTIHKSKGLEEDNVIIINLLDNNNSLPSKIKEYDIFKYIKKRDKYLFEEERRLFYVAITRCRKKVFLFTKKNKESIFVKELIKDYKLKINVFKFD